MYKHQGSSTELHKLTLLICFKWFKKILVSLVDKMAKENWNFIPKQ